MYLVFPSQCSPRGDGDGEGELRLDLTLARITSAMELSLSPPVDVMRSTESGCGDRENRVTITSTVTDTAGGVKLAEGGWVRTTLIKSLLLAD